jgi:hypothetical protein
LLNRALNNLLKSSIDEPLNKELNKERNFFSAEGLINNLIPELKKKTAEGRSMSKRMEG